MQEKLLLAVCSCALMCSLAAPQTIEVDFGKQDPTDPALYGRCINICGGGQEFTESDLKLFQEQMGRLKLVRIWGTTFAKYAQQMADEALMVSSQVTLLKQLFEGAITEQGYTSSVAKSIEKAKDQYPFITYIEPFNELSPKSIQPPAGVSMEEAYYRGFRATYRAVNELNREHAYAKPLKVGGCACMWPQYKKGYINKFLACYAKDSDPGKRLDFISVHFYTDDFEKIMSFRRDIEGTLKELGLPVPQLIMSEAQFRCGRFKWLWRLQRRHLRQNRRCATPMELRRQGGTLEDRHVEILSCRSASIAERARCRVPPGPEHGELFR
ncbi:MAG: hypothetical protein NTW86_01970 [Candidatus Sumerlaeota bacterium]|nr:hypothetical protein [Candidatus Sumerlaeota bacterium]